MVIATNSHKSKNLIPTFKAENEIFKFWAGSRLLLSLQKCLAHFLQETLLIPSPIYITWCGSGISHFLTLPKPYLSKKFTNVCNNFKTLFSICFSPFSPPRDQSVVTMGEFLNLPKLLWCTPFIPHAYVLNSIEDTSKIVYRDSWIIIFMSSLE